MVWQRTNKKVAEYNIKNDATGLDLEEDNEFINKQKTNKQTDDNIKQTMNYV